MRLIYYAVCGGCLHQMSGRTPRALQQAVADHLATRHSGVVAKDVDLGLDRDEALRRARAECEARHVAGE